jgi:hypothetical protein
MPKSSTKRCQAAAHSEFGDRWGSVRTFVITPARAAGRSRPHSFQAQPTMEQVEQRQRLAMVTFTKVPSSPQIGPDNRNPLIGERITTLRVLHL